MTLFCHNNLLQYCSDNMKGENMTMRRKMILFVLTVLFVLMLNACGGGGGGDDDTSATNNQWDQISWNQGKWGMKHLL